MIKEIYYIIIGYFILGALGFYFINRKKPLEKAKQSYIKFITYFVIINVIFFCITLNQYAFRVLSSIIAVAGITELTSLYIKDKSSRNLPFYLRSIFIYLIVSVAFIAFSFKPKEYLLFSFLTLSIFDSFSQIFGQIFGKRKIVPNISPNKTWEGSIGGGITALLSTFWLKGLLTEPVFNIWMVTTGIIFFAFTGDIAASLYKRKFSVKDYNNLIPGHGGFLDRFDSLIVAGAWSWIGFSILS